MQDMQALSCRKFRLNKASRNIYFEFFKISGFYSHARATRYGLDSSIPYLHCSGKLSNLMKYYIA